MSEPSRYDYVPYSVAVAVPVQTVLLELARSRADPELLNRVSLALRELSHILRTYPQHGEPLSDLVLASATVRLLTVPPVVARFALYEVQRVVVVYSFKVL